eukprot:15261991-Heterocapsa_arctica.AAC.1
MAVCFLCTSRRGSPSSWSSSSPGGACGATRPRCAGAVRVENLSTVKGMFASLDALGSLRLEGTG